MASAKERFLKYVKVDTQSAYDKEELPSTHKQFDLAEILVKELEELGLQDVSLDEHCYVMATLPANIDKKIPVIGFIAHMAIGLALTRKKPKPKELMKSTGKE